MSSKVEGAHVYGYEADALFGARYAFDVSGGLLMSLRAGALFKGQEVDWHRMTYREGFEAYDDLLAGYVGLAVNSAERPGVEFYGHYFADGRDLAGFLLSLGWRF